MDVVIDSIFIFVPGLKECIEYKNSATPLTYEDPHIIPMERVVHGVGILKRSSIKAA